MTKNFRTRIYGLLIEGRYNEETDFAPIVEAVYKTSGSESVHFSKEVEVEMMEVARAITQDLFEREKIVEDYYKEGEICFDRIDND